MYNNNNYVQQGGNQQMVQMSPKELSDFMQLEDAVGKGIQLDQNQVTYYNQLRNKAILVQQQQQAAGGGQYNGGYPQNNNFPQQGGGYIQQGGTYPQNNQHVNPNYAQQNNMSNYVAQNVPYGNRVNNNNMGGHFVPNSQVGPNVTTAATSTGRYSSNSNSMMDKKPIIPTAAPVVEQANQAPVEPVKPFESNVPLEGYEYPFLTLTTQACIKETVGAFFIYKTIDKKDTEVDFHKHASIYRNTIPKLENKIDTSDAKQISFNKDTLMVNTYLEAFNDLRMSSGNNKDESIFNVGEYSLLNSGVVNKITTDSTVPMFKDMVLSSKDLKDLADKMCHAMEKGGKYTKITMSDFDENIAKFINLVYRNGLGSKLNIDSFVGDIDSLFEYIAELKDPGKRRIFTAAMSDIYNFIKLNAGDVDNDLDEDKDQLETKVGLTYMATRVTMVTSNSEDVTYELVDLMARQVKYIKPDLTPVLSSIINAVNDADYSNKIIILLDKDGSQYRIMKTKLSVDFTIEKIK